MNINQLKAFLGEKPPHLGSESSIQNQLRESGLRQAAALQSGQAQLKSDQFSSSATFGARVFASAMYSSLEINAKKPDFSASKTQIKAEKSLFDFEEVAKNVLKFVGGAIKNAKNNGADEAELNKMFEQASSGVLKGIKLAEKDLAGFMNDEIKAGIASSKELIEAGIDKLRQQLLAPAEQDAAQTTTAVQSSSQVSVASQQSGQLVIKTKDGDEVRLSFEDVRQFSLNQQLLVQQQQQAAEKPAPEQQQPAANPAPVVESQPESTANPDDANNAGQNVAQQDSNVASSRPADEQHQVATTEPSIVQQNSIFYQSSSLSFSLTGELDEDELKAIGQLVADANDLADEFFNGDIETAYNQALKMGFDDQELTGFALQLTKVENTQVIKTYESVSHYDDNNAQGEPAKAVKPVAHYLDKMLDVVEEARLKLQDGKSFENMINELINQMGEVHTPDLIHAINRFHSFNQKLLDNLPLSFKLDN